MATYLVPILVILLGGFGWVIRQELEKRRRIEEQLSHEKYLTYMIFVDAMFGLFHQQALERENIEHRPTKESDLVVKLQEFSKKVIFYGSDDVIRAYQEFMSHSQESAEAPNVVKSSENMAKVIVAIRKDMGHPNTKFTPKTFVKQLINDYHKHCGVGGIFYDFDQRYRDI